MNILLIGNNTTEKEKFLEELRKYSKYSYTVLEAIFETIMDIYPNAFPKDSDVKELNFSQFVQNYLINLNKHNDLNVIDIGYISPQNLNRIMSDKTNNKVIYFLNEEIDIEQYGFIKIDMSNKLELQLILKDIMNM